MGYMANGDEKLKTWFGEYLKTVSLQYVVDCVRLLSMLDAMDGIEDCLCSDDVIGLYDVAREECVRRCTSIAENGFFKM